MSTRAVRLAALVAAAAVAVALVRRLRPSTPTAGETTTSTGGAGRQAVLVDGAGSNREAVRVESEGSTEPLHPTPSPRPPVAELTEESADATPAGLEVVAWVDPDDEGVCPVAHPVKAKKSSGIYHLPGGALYDRTRPDRCYRSPEAAEVDGYRASKR